MTVTTLGSAPTVATSNATMRTYASPTHNGAAVAVWRTEMPAGAAGPVHTVSEDQVLVVLASQARIRLRDRVLDLVPGDGVVLPAGDERQVSALGDGLTAIVSGLPGATARVGSGEPVPLPWAG